MTPYEMLEKLEVEAARIRTHIPAVMQVAHLCELMPDDVPSVTDPAHAQEVLDAFLVKSLNRLAARMGCHYTIRVEHLRRRKQRIENGS